MPLIGRVWIEIFFAAPASQWFTHFVYAAQMEFEVLSIAVDGSTVWADDLYRETARGSVVSFGFGDLGIIYIFNYMYNFDLWLLLK